MGKIKVAIIGVGNCASSLVQGIHKYVEIPEDVEISGVMHNTIGGYRIEDIEVVAAFDIDENKVGKTCPSNIRSAKQHDQIRRGSPKPALSSNEV
ncbi:MAG: hypothetical protein CM1200mP22_14440 [Dehalococcoidia bacterium]|nr:MAG: hypothetical protein CM1200mP22_14440 [Dehalococcoidia bacterium]